MFASLRPPDEVVTGFRSATHVAEFLPFEVRSLRGETSAQSFNKLSQVVNAVFSQVSEPTFYHRFSDLFAYLRAHSASILYDEPHTFATSPHHKHNIADQPLLCGFRLKRPGRSRKVDAHERQLRVAARLRERLADRSCRRLAQLRLRGAAGGRARH
eukprot:3705010-Prymnesium_polylepis.1